jgi:hypothetical protein
VNNTVVRLADEERVEAATGVYGRVAIYPLRQPRYSATGGGKSIRTMCWLTIGILLTSVFVLTLASLWLLDSHRVYTKVFCDDHFHEVAARLPALKRAALERVFDSEPDAVCTPEDSRGMLTSAGLAVLYLVGRQGSWFHHDLSVSVPIRPYTAHAVGDVFICFLAHLLGIGMERLRLRVSSRIVHHAEFTLSALEHQQFADQPVASLSLDVGSLPPTLGAVREEGKVGAYSVMPTGQGRLRPTRGRGVRYVARR